MINPSIFIGLGSSGTDILEHLQLLVLEEYDTPELPIFKFIGIETNQAHIPKAAPGTKSTIEMVYLTVNSTLKVKDELERGEKDYLEEWLDEAILDIPGNSFTLGASNIRQAGRLCLWENWSKITEAFNNAKAKVTNDTNIRSTIQLLRDRYKKVGKKVSLSEDVIGLVPNIYIVGSLCGGTCSGIFIDIAYYIRHLFGLWSANYENKLSTNICGIFTILDEKLLSRSRFPDIDKWGANCWASLIELDFYSHPSSMYEVKFPDGVRIKSNDTPFDYTYILSCSGQGGAFWKEDGTEPDLVSLNHNLAMILFTEAVADLYSRKEEIRTDFRGFCDAQKPNQNEHMPCLASCGLSYVWYPKYRVSEASACYVAKSLCKKWQGEIDELDKTSIIEDAKSFWKKMINENIGFLTKKPGGSIESEIRERFIYFKQKLLSSKMKDILEEMDINGMLQRLREDEEDDEIIRNQLAIFKKQIVDGIEKALISRINKTKDLSNVSLFLQALDKEIEKTVDSLPLRYPVITSFFLDELQEETYADIWAKIVGKGREVEKAKKERVFESCLLQLLSVLKDVRGFRMKPVLAEVREVLGVGIQPPSERISIRPFRQELDEMSEKLSLCMEKLTERADAASRIRRYQGVEIVANNEHNDIAEDIKVLRGKLTSMGSAKWKRVMNEIFTVKEGEASRKEELAQFLRHSVDEIVDRLTSCFQREALELIKGFNIAEDIQKKMDRASLVLLARRSLCYLGLSGNLVKLQRSPTFLCGNDAEDMANIRSLQELLEDPASLLHISFTNQIRTPEMDHLLIFYTEQGLLYLDTNIATAELFESKYREAQTTGLYEIHTKKGGKIHFDVQTERRREEAKRLIKMAREILSEDEIFEKTKEGFIFRYTDSVGINTIWAVDRQPEDAIITDPAGFFQFKKKVLSVIEKERESGLRERINRYIKQIEKEKGGDWARREAEYYKDVIRKYLKE